MQIVSHNLDVTEKTFQRFLNKRRRAKRFKKRKIKTITKRNKGKRIEYDIRNENKSLAY